MTASFFMRSYPSSPGAAPSDARPEADRTPTQPNSSGPDWLLWLVIGLLTTALLLMGLTNFPL